MQDSKSGANRRFHDRIAGKYDQIYPADDPYWKFYREVTWRHLKGFLPTRAGAPVLDLGCGTGEWGLRLLRSGFRVTFVDLSGNMVTRARQRASKERNAALASFLQADLMDLGELESATFAFATAQGDPISLCKNPTKALREIARCLEPGGVLVASMDNRCPGYDYYLEKHDLKGLLEFYKTGVTEWLAHKPEERFPVHTMDPEEMRKAFGRSGLEVLGMIGKTVLPVRKHPALLADDASYRQLLKLEEKLHGREAYLGRASHLQVAARRVKS